MLGLRRLLRPQRPNQGTNRHSLPRPHSPHPSRTHPPQPPRRPHPHQATRPRLQHHRLPRHRRPLAHLHRPRQPHPGRSRQPHLHPRSLVGPRSHRRQRPRLALVLLHQRASPPLSQPPRPSRLRHRPSLPLLGTPPPLAHALERLPPPRPPHCPMAQIPPPPRLHPHPQPARKHPSPP